MAETLRVKHEVFRSTVPFPREVDVIELDDANANTWTCPAGTRVVLLASDQPFYMRAVDTAAIPTTDLTDGNGSMYVPATGVFEVEEGVAYSLIRATANATLVTIGRYSA